jgi:ubiquinone biosynthesis protein
MALAKFKSLGRLADVAGVLVKNGFAEIAERLELPGKAGPGTKASGEKLAKKYPLWVRLRLMAEDLGPTFIKLGQLMSQRPDLLPKELILELRKLQDQVSPEDIGDIRRTIHKALGKPVEEIFSEFSEKPLASASLAQVHSARLLESGLSVAVKVRRPGVAEVIEADLALLTNLAQALHERVEGLRPYNLPGLVQEMAQHLRLELDFNKEARNMLSARSRRDDKKLIIIPEPHLELTRQPVLVMDLVEGCRIEDACLDKKQGKQLAQDLGDAMLDQVFKQGFFHADPHPGNVVLVTATDRKPRLALVDWGLVGHLTAEMRYLIGDIMAAMVEKNAKRVVSGLIKMGAAPAGVDQASLVDSVEQLLELVHSKPLNEIDLGSLILEVMELMREHRLQAQVQFALLHKALLELDGLMRELDPEINPVAVAQPYVRALWMERYRPDVILTTLRHNLADGLDLIKDLPRRLDRLLGMLEKGELGIQFKHKGLVPLTQAIESSANRVAVALIVAALIVGSSMIITTGAEPKLFGLPAMGLVGYLISAVIGLWLVWTILRSRRGKF